MTKSNFDGALEWVRAGAYAFPCKPDKTPYTEHGHNDATNDELQIQSWWSIWPDALIGVNLGKSGLVGFDFDGEIGQSSYKRMIARYPELETSYTEKTPKGKHVILFAGDLRVTSANKAFKEQRFNLPEVDIKSTGGYFIVAPSKGINGAYIVEKNLPFTPLSSDLIKLLDDRGLIVDEKSFVNAVVDRFTLPQDKIKQEFYPPCIIRILNDLRDGVNLEHSERVFLVSFLYAIGHDAEYIKTLFVKSPDYNKKMTDYQVNHIIEKPYKCPTCATMAKWGYCLKDSSCKDNKNPTWCFKNKFFANWNYELNDTGAVKLLGDMYGENILYVKPMRVWLWWDGTIWQVQDRKSNELVKMVRDLSKIYKVRADFLEENHKDNGMKEPHKDKLVNAFKSFYKTVNSKAHAESIVDLAAHLLTQRHVENADKLDSVPNVLNVNNGLLDLDSGQLIKDIDKSKSMLITMQANVIYDPDAKCPVFDQFLNEVTLNRPELRHYILKQLGYALSGYTKEEQAFAWLGIGRNGKTKLAEIIFKILGAYAISASSQAFIISRGGSNGRFSFARLRGTRFIKCSEVPEGASWNVERFKQFVGGDTITAEEKGEKEFDFKPTGKLFFLFNDMPAMPKNRSTEDKITVTPFNLNLEKDEQDKDLLDKLLSEKSGILNRLLEGYQAWVKEGFKDVPKPVQEATEAYWRDVDWFAAFIGDNLTLDKKSTIKNEALYKTYEVWAKKNGLIVLTHLAVSKRLMKMGFKQGKNNKGDRIWLGLQFNHRLMSDPDWITTIKALEAA